MLLVLLINIFNTKVCCECLKLLQTDRCLYLLRVAPSVTKVTAINGSPHKATSHATCLAIVLLLQAMQEVELDPAFCNDMWQWFFFSVAQCNPPPETCLAMLCSISQSGSLLSSPRSQFCEFLPIPLHSVTAPVHATAMLHVVSCTTK